MRPRQFSTKLNIQLSVWQIRLSNWGRKAPQEYVDDTQTFQSLKTVFEEADASHKLADGDLADRLADAVKIILNAALYSLLFPAGYFFHVGALLLTYALDKYQHLRRLRPPKARDPHDRHCRCFGCPVLCEINQCVGCPIILHYGYSR